MQSAFLLHAMTDTRLYQQVHTALFENTGTDGGFNLGATAAFQYDRFDTLQMQ